MSIKRKLERIEKAVSTGKVYTPGDLEELKSLPESSEVLFDWGEVMRAVVRARAKARGSETETHEKVEHIRPSKVGEVKAFFGFLERIAGR